MVKSYYIYGCSVYYIYGQILLHLWFVDLLHLWLKVISFMVSITFMVNFYYIYGWYYIYGFYYIYGWYRHNPCANAVTMFYSCETERSEGPGKRGHIVADTMLPMMFLGLRKPGNICCGHIFGVPDTKFVSATNVARAGKQGNICVGNNVSATMCPRLPGP